MRSRAARRLALGCREALIRQDFAYRFHMAMREACALARHAAIARLKAERQAMLKEARASARAEDIAERKERLAASGAQARLRRFRIRLRRRRSRRPASPLRRALRHELR